MDYYYINTDTDALEHSPHMEWIEHNCAFTSGNYEKYGVKILERLNRGYICFMYAKLCGVLAAGRVCESWDGCSYTGGDRLIYQATPHTEYRIRVDWCHTVVDNPISLNGLRNIIGWTPVSTLQRITDTNAAKELLEEIRNRALNQK